MILSPFTNEESEAQEGKKLLRGHAAPELFISLYYID